MATIQTVDPQGLYGRALFNFDETAGWSNFKLAGLVKYSTSDTFGRPGSVKGIYEDLYASYGDTTQGEVIWRPAELGAIQKLFSTINSFAGVDFGWAGDFDYTSSSTRANPSDVGGPSPPLSDINITVINRPDVVWAGLSGGGQEYLGYTGSVGDIFINVARFAPNPLVFDEYSELNQTLMHEVLHSLGLSHPFGDTRDLTTDFSALVSAGFESLGFVIDGPEDLNKEYFTIMSYDDQPSVDAAQQLRNNAYTPMILDVLALQEVYGEGRGTHGSGDDTIVAGNAGYRAYFDRGGVDAVDLEIYSGGAYIDLGLPIGGSTYQVGLVLPEEEAAGLLAGTASPQNLRWLYGNIENVLGSEGPDQILDSDSDNALSGRGGDDRFVQLRTGDDWIDGGTGQDTVVYRHAQASYAFSVDEAERLQIHSANASDRGTDTLVAVELLEFADSASASVDALIRRIMVPAAVATSIVVTEDIALSGQLTSSAINPASVTFIKVSDPSHGSVVLNESGVFTYTPAPDFNGSDSFAFKVSAGTEETTPATVSITVLPVNDPATGTLEIVGRLGQGLTVGVAVSVSDPDGVPALSSAFDYRWLSGQGAAAIEVGRSPTLTLTQSMAGKPLSFQVSYTDGSGNPERIDSAESALVTAAALTGTALNWAGARLVPDVKLLIQPASFRVDDSTRMTTTSDGSGRWAFEALDFDRFSISANKAVTAGDLQAVSAADVLATLKIAHGRNPNPDPDGSGALPAAPLSPYQLYSADVDRDEKVSEVDARIILHTALTTTPDPPRALSWLFLDQSADLSGLKRDHVPEPEPIVAQADLSTDVRLLGILLGDVDGNWMRA